MEVKEESEKAGLKLNIQKTKIMASSPNTSCQIDGETMETVTDFIFWGSKSTADGDCSHEIKRHLLFGRKAMTNLDNILKSRYITLLTKVRLVKAMVLPVILWNVKTLTPEGLTLYLEWAPFLFIYTPVLLYWRRQWYPTPVLLPGTSHGQRSPGRPQSMGLQRVGYN